MQSISLLYQDLFLCSSATLLPLVLFHFCLFLLDVIKVTQTCETAPLRDWDSQHLQSTSTCNLRSTCGDPPTCDLWCSSCLHAHRPRWSVPRKSTTIFSSCYWVSHLSSRSPCDYFERCVSVKFVWARANTVLVSNLLNFKQDSGCEVCSA